MWIRPLPPSRVYVLYTVAYRQKGFDYKLRYKIFCRLVFRRKFWRRIDRMYGTNNYIYPGVKGSLSTFDVDFLRICLHSEETDGIVSCMGPRYTWNTLGRAPMCKTMSFHFSRERANKRKLFSPFFLIWFDSTQPCDTSAYTSRNVPFEDSEFVIIWWQMSRDIWPPFRPLTSSKRKKWRWTWNVPSIATRIYNQTAGAPALVDVIIAMSKSFLRELLS